MKIIHEFKGEYRFLSNFYPAPITTEFADGIILSFPTSEHAYQASKSIIPKEWNRFVTAPKCVHTGATLQPLTAGQSKGAGRRVTLRSDWDHVKRRHMLLILNEKFTQNPDLKEKLLATGDAYLMEGNYWNDTYWGVDLKSGKFNGLNNLGQVLMEIRYNLKGS